MATIGELGQFTMDELSDFTINELDAMSYETLLAAVRGKYEIAQDVCIKDAPLTDEQITLVKKSYPRRNRTSDFYIAASLGCWDCI